MDTVLIGSRIRAARKRHDMKAEELAEQLGIAVESLWHIENGARRTSFQTLLNIADILDVSLDYLAGRTQSPTEMLIKEQIDDDSLTDKQREMLLDAAKHLVPFVKEYQQG